MLPSVLMLLGFAAGGSSPAPAAPTGGHFWPTRHGKPIEPDDWRKRSADERKAFLLSLIADVNDAPLPVIEAAKEAVAAYDSPQAPDNQLVVRQVQLARLASNLAAVERLARVYQQWVDDGDDEAVLLLLT